MFGIMASVLCIGAFIPQILKCYRTKNTRDISLVTYFVLSGGVFCWVCHGIIMGDDTLAISNAIFLPLVGCILLMKIKYG